MQTHSDSLKRQRFISDDGNGSYERVRKGGRGLLIQDGKVLLGHELATGFYCTPGGGVEEGETLEEACIREMAEEAGVIVEIKKEIAVVDSLYKYMIFENHFFLCEKKGDIPRNLTEQEQNVQLQQEWIPLEEAKRIFSDPETLKKNPDWAVGYLRDSWILENFS